MLVRPPIEILLDDGFWDELEEAGIEDVGIQWLALLDPHGNSPTRYPQPEDTHPRGFSAIGGKAADLTPVPAYAPNHSLYEGLSFSPQEMPEHMEAASKMLKLAVERATDRGFSVWMVDDKGYFLHGGFGDGTQRKASYCTNDPDLAGYAVQRARDNAANFPGLHGMILDGPDFKWEIKPGHRDDLFVGQCGCRHCERVAKSVGLTYARVLEGRDEFGRLLHSLSDESVEDMVANRAGVFGAFDWWMERPAIVDWMRFNTRVVEQHLKAISDGIHEDMPEMKVATSSRMPSLAPITGHNLRRKAAFNDYEMPKLYWWSGGVAGWRGTAMNWVDTLVDWNDGLSRESATRWFSTAFDIPIPDDYPTAAMAEEAPDSFFEQTVDDQIRKMIANSGGIDRFMPWVGLEHFGSNWVTTSELERMLRQMQAHGVERYSYFVYNEITPEIWDVITSFSRG
jgi:hypothetical protein